MTRSISKIKRMFPRLSVVSLCIFLLCTRQSIFGQVDTGTISGTVYDSTGAVVPGVKVTIVAIATNQNRALTTDNAGRYTSGPLRPGVYKIEAEREGYKHLTSSNIQVQIQQAIALDLTMQVGTVVEQITVTSAAPLIQTEDASQGSVIGGARVANMPLNGRDYLQLALLSEGTLPPPGQGRTASGANGNNNSRAGGFSAGGVRTTDNNYLVDGFDNNTDDTSFDTNQAEVVKP